MAKRKYAGMPKGSAGAGSYEGLESARNQERRDSMMISEDHSAVANLPQQVMYKPWPKAGHYADYDLDDTIRGVDEQMDDDGRKMKAHKGGLKY